MPSAERAELSVRVQLPPAEQLVVEGDVGLPPSVTITGPSPLVQGPPTEVTFCLVENGKLTELPLTESSVTVGAVLSIVYTFPAREAAVSGT